MSAKWLIGSLALLAGGSQAVDLNLTGSVYDSTGKGILGVKVRMLGTGLSTRTGPDGAWSIVAVVPSSLLAFPDTVVFGDDPDAPFLERVPLAGPDRSGIVMIGPRSQLLARKRSLASSATRSGSRSISDVPSTVAPRPVAQVAEAPTASAPVASRRAVPEPEPKKERTRDSGMVALNWEHTVPSGAFVVEASFGRESWTGGYGLFPLLFDSPASYDYSLVARYGLWEFDNGARSELVLGGLYLNRNRDAGSYDGFAAPSLGFKFGLLSSFGLKFQVTPPLGSSEIVGPEKDWAYGVGFYLSPRTERFQFNLEGGFGPDPVAIYAHAEPQLDLTKWLGAYTAVDFQLGSGPLSEAGGESFSYKLLWVEPGVRLNLGRNLGVGAGVPFTVYGDDQVARWAVKATLRGAFGL